MVTQRNGNFLRPNCRSPPVTRKALAPLHNPSPYHFFHFPPSHKGSFISDSRVMPHPLPSPPPQKVKQIRSPLPEHVYDNDARVNERHDFGNSRGKRGLAAFLPPRAYSLRVPTLASDINSETIQNHFYKRTFTISTDLTSRTEQQITACFSGYDLQVAVAQTAVLVVPRPRSCSRKKLSGAWNESARG